MSAQVRNRLLANEAARKAAARTPAPQKAKGSYPQMKYSKTPNHSGEKLGIPVRSDKGSVEGLNLTARRMRLLDDASGMEYEVYEITGKLTRETWSKTWDKMKPIGTIGELEFELADDAKALCFQGGPWSFHPSMKVTDGETTFELYIDGQTRRYNGWRGFFRLRTPVTSNGAADAANMRNMLQKLELDDLLLNPDTEAEKILKKSRLIWQNAPHRIQELDGLTPEQIPAKLDMIIRQEGIDPKCINNMKMVKVFDGYSTYVEEGI